MLIGAVKTIRRWIGAAAIPGIAALAGSGWQLRLVFAGVFVLVAGSAVWGFLSWRTTTYGVSGGAFHLRRGVLRKTERTIPLEHVQSVDTVQGIIQRVFSVIELRVESAGGGAKEPDATLSALSRDAAEALRREIEDFRRAVAGTEDEKTAGPAIIRQLGTRDLLIAGATSGQIGAAFALIAAASQFFDDFLPDSFAERLVLSLSPDSVKTILLIVLAFGFFAWLLAIGGTVLAYAGFILSRDGDFLYIRRGLLERREATIPLARIQAVKVVEGILRQPFGLAMLRVESAGYGEAAGVSTTLFPLLPRKEAQELLLEVAPEFAVDARLNPLPSRARRRYIFRAMLPALFIVVALTAVSFFALDSVVWGSLAPLLLVPAAFLGWLRYKAAGWAFTKDCLVVRSRFLALTTAIAPRCRLQSRGVTRSPFQRRVRLATLRALVASGRGGVALEVVDLEDASADSLLRHLGPRPGLEGGPL